MSPRFASPSELYGVSRIPRGAIERWRFVAFFRVCVELGLGRVSTLLVARPGHVHNWLRGARCARPSLRCVRLGQKRAPRIFAPPVSRAGPPPPKRVGESAGKRDSGNHERRRDRDVGDCDDVRPAGEGIPAPGERKSKRRSERNATAHPAPGEDRQRRAFAVARHGGRAGRTKRW